jgi:hypothetical protein
MRASHSIRNQPETWKELSPEASHSQVLPETSPDLPFSKLNLSEEEHKVGPRAVTEDQTKPSEDIEGMDEPLDTGDDLEDDHNIPQKMHEASSVRN